jgi:ketosteroid isomerase-like protein
MPTKLQAVREMESAAFSGNWDMFKSYLAEDVYYRVGNTAEMRGPQAVVHYMIKLLSTGLAINDLQTKSAWETGDVVILEANMAGLRLRDKREVTYPCLDICRFSSGKISDWRVYAIEPTFVY